MNDKLYKYLGDGVYASFDGYAVVLAVGNHENDVIALDPYVIRALFRYVDRVKLHLKEKENKK